MPEGLPQSTVKAIVQTRDGYLWLGTFGGLVRFDGVRFSVFTTTNTPALTDNRIGFLFEDPDGSLWIGMEHGGLVRFANGVFHPAITPETGLPGTMVTSMSVSRDGGLWVGLNGGVARLRDGRFTSPIGADALVGRQVLDIHEDSHGTLWIATSVGLARLRDGHVTHLTEGDGAPANALAETPDGSIWVGTASGLTEFKREAAGGYAPGVPRARGVVNALVFDREGALWIALNAEIARLENGELRRLGSGGLGRAHILSLATDREGGLWIGTDTAGLVQWRRRLIHAVSAGAGGTSVMSVFQDREGTIWFGAYCGGLHRLRGGRLDGYEASELFLNACVSSVAEDRAGILWVGTTAGLFGVRDGRRIAWYGRENGLPTNRIWALFVDRAGALWIGTSSGLSRFDGGRFTHYTPADGLVRDDVRYIMQDRTGALWIGTVGGVSRFDGDRFVNYTTRNGLSHDFVRAIHEDDEGTIWLGSYGGGLTRFRDGRFAHVTTEHGLPEDIVSRILEDASETFWMSGNRGIFRVARSELNAVADRRLARVSPVVYDASDGMPSSETNGGGQPAGWLSRDGRVWLPTIAGLAVIDPGETAGVPPPVHVERTLVDGRTLPPQDLELPAGAHSVEIAYTGIDLATPHKVVFRYRLEGYDREWVDAGSRRVAFYTGLPPGQYRFRVIARSGDGVWNEDGTAVALRQLPFFYQTPAFMALAVVALVTSAFGAYRLRLRGLVRRTAELELKVAERTTQLQEKSERLATANTLLTSANDRLEDANRQMLTSLNHLRVGVAIANGDGDITFLSDSAQGLLSLDAAALGSTWTSALPFEPQDRSELQRLAALPASARAKVPATVRAASGRRRALEVEVRDDPRDRHARIFYFYDVSELYDLRDLLDDKAQFHGLVGRSGRMQVVFRQVRDVAQVDTTVLVEGETGTGKELVARAIHYASLRRGRAFVPVNCGTLTESLVASQLFGHRRGAFTGATGDQVGLFEAAEGGTVFLDEIGDIPPPLQTSLLRVLEEREITRVGDARARRIDVRVIAATHRDLAEAVADGRFREDLLYRIRVARIHLPALRERREDIPLLVSWFLGQTRAGRETVEMSHEAMACLIEYDWPGNVRELRSAIESACIRRTGPVIRLEDLPPELLASGASTAPLETSSRGEEWILRNALERAGGNRSEAARLLGIARSTFYRRLKMLGLD